MDEDELQALERLTLKATPAPWVDYTNIYFERCQEDRAQYGRRWYHGTERASKPLLLIAHGAHHGEPIRPEDIPRRVDKFDLKTVFAVFWSLLPKRQTVATEGFMRPEDAAFIIAARTAVPQLIAHVRAGATVSEILGRYLESREEERRISTEFIAAIRGGSGASDEVKQESSDRLLAARQRSHALYRALHLAATGGEAARYGKEQVDP